MMHFHPSGLQAGGKSRVGERVGTVEHQEFSNNRKCFSQQKRLISRRNKTLRDRQTWVQGSAVSLITCVNWKDCGRLVMCSFPYCYFWKQQLLSFGALLSYVMRPQGSALLPPTLLSDSTHRDQLQCHKPPGHGKEAHDVCQPC